MGSNCQCRDWLSVYVDFRCNYKGERGKPSKTDMATNTLSVSQKDELLIPGFYQINTSVTYA